MTAERVLSQLHYELIRALIQRGVCPTNFELAEKMRVSPEKVEQRLRSLADIHGVVLHPHACEPWVLHPFSLTPTINWIEDLRSSWWSPCIWCALGVAALVGGEVRIHTRYGAESEPLVIPVLDGQLGAFDRTYVHFAIPPARAWDNVHQHCSMVLPFRSENDIDEWCSRHRLPRGEAVPLHQVARLAKLWYGSHSNAGWRKWTVAEAQEIFYQAGLRSGFWDLGSRIGKF
ncbi:MAG: hypothetical protein JO210_11145 [Acidobacteriaceae bacterium]|nr:hypothetical protein [Acidobacteriaceae bacterium]